MAPATGEAVLTDDGVQLYLVVAPKVGRTQIKGGPSDRSAELHIPFRLIGRCGSDQRGVWLEVVGRGTMWLLPRDRGEFGQWLAHLSHGKTWQPPVQVTMQASSPVAGWCQQDPRFTFGFPQRWVQAPPHALADYGRLFAPSVLRAGVVESAGEWEAQVFVIDNGQQPRQTAGPTSSSWRRRSLTRRTSHPTARSRSRAWAANSPRCCEVTPGSRARPSTAAMARSSHAGTLYALWYGVVGGTTADGSYENWLPAFHTMLATWHWYA